MLHRVQEIDRTGIQGHWFATWTVPAGEAGWVRIERLRRAYFKRFGRKWGASAFVVWKKEEHPQQRGTIHLHGIIFWVDAPPDLLVFRSWNDVAWARTVGSENPAHERTGCNVQRVKTWRGVTCYVAKYLGKEAEAVDEPTGRIWSIYNKRVVPKSVRVDVVSKSVGFRITRAQRKLQQSKRRRFRFRIGVQGSWVKCYARVYGIGSRSAVYSVEDQIAVARRAAEFMGVGFKVRVRRPKGCTTVPVKIWQEVHDSASRRSRVQSGGVELHAFTPGRHFVESSESIRCIEFFKLQAARDAAGGVKCG